MTHSDVRDGQRGARPTAGTQQSPRRGRRFDTWGWFALVLGSLLLDGALLKIVPWERLKGTWFAPFWVVMELAQMPWAKMEVLPGTAVGLAMVMSGAGAVLRGRRHRQRVLSGLRAAPDDERVVLFLRSFTVDSGFARAAVSRVDRWMMWPPPITPADVRTEEEQVARGVAPFGRLVALGRPSERLPRAGAERSYTSDELWQHEVLAALDRAELVLLTAGTGESLRWEVEQVLRRDDPTRLVLLVNRKRQHYLTFRESVGNFFPKGLPEDPQERASRSRYVRAVVWFERDWSPHLELLSGRFPLFRSTARTQHALARALRPVYDRAGLRAPGKDSSSLTRPRMVPAGVALFSAAWFGATALFVALLVYSVTRLPGSGGSVRVDFSGESPMQVLVMCGAMLALVVLPFVMWMRRVLRGGPIAVLLVRFLCVLQVFVLPLATGLQVIFAVVVMKTGAGAAALPVLLLSLNLLALAVVLPIAIVLLLMHRDVRDWIDSRT